ncbi:MAG TPA: TIGR03668 family PPOX class F420-dependent oxidoreductase [Actinomycetota bacterium]
MDDAEARALAAAARVGHLATVRPDGAPHVVPCVFVLYDEQIYTPIDRKPKRSRSLQRLRNIEHEPRVALLADEYDEEWERLWWVRLDGRARVLDDGPEHERGLALLADKYVQYREDPPDDRVIAIDVERVTGWRYR